MKICIYGGAGFIGTNLAIELSKEHMVKVYDDLTCGDHNVAVLANHNIRVIEQNIYNLTAVPMQADIIINLACPASPVKYKQFPMQTMKASTLGTESLVVLAQTLNAYFLHASSSEIYGSAENMGRGMTEDQNVVALNTESTRAIYAESKRVSEAICNVARRYGQKIGIMRIFNTYGPYMDLDDGRIIPELCKSAMGISKFPMQGGTQSRSYMYIDDLVRAIKLMIYNKQDGIYNIGNPGCSISVKDLFQHFKTRWPITDANITTPKRDNEIQKRIPNISKIRQDLNWEPYVMLENGIERTMEWAISSKS
jgi:nucleoside-diphosphate-sugar epimerase